MTKRKQNRTYQVYIFSKKKSGDIWSRESFRIRNSEVAKLIRDYKKENRKYGYTQFKVIKLPVRK